MIDKKILNVIEILNTEGYNIIYIDNVIYNVIKWQVADSNIEKTSITGQNILDLVNNFSDIRTFINKIESLPQFTRYYHKNQLWIFYESV